MLDVDQNETTDGFAALACLEEQHGKLPDTLRSVTPRGGSHYFFQWRDGIKNTASKLGRGLDIRGDGGYIILPPSCRDDGKSYEWAETSASTPAEGPQWLIDLLVASKGKLTRLAQPNIRTDGNEDTNGYARAALERECANVVTAQVGTRNDTLNRASYNLHQLVATGALTESEVHSRLFGAAIACGSVKDDGADAVLATIKSGATAGLRLPRPLPEQRARHTANENGNQRAWEQGIFTASDLQSMTFPPVAWLVPDIIPAEGVTLLCSKPKFGKSWLAYDLCIACTTDRYMLGTIKPAQGDVLYLALEDSKRRLQRRMGKLLPTFKDKWPSRLGIATGWLRLHEGGLDGIRAWHESTKQKDGAKPLAVVIDVLAKVRKPTGNKPVYEADYEALTGLCQLAHELNIAIMVIHHTRKMAADDLMETVNGSYGLTGAVDTVVVMASKAGGSVFDIRGRDVESAELAIQFSKDSCRWTVLGTAAEVHQSDQRKTIVAAIVESGEPMRINELAAATGMKRNPLELLLGKMVRDQSIKRIGVGLYAHKDYTPPPEPTNGKSVRSVRHHSVTRQAAGRPQATDKTQENAGFCSSVRSVREVTAKPEASGLAAERVKTRTDQTDGQIKAQGTEEPEALDSGDLSGLGTDRTDAPATPEFLRVCAQCGAGSPDDPPTIPVKTNDGATVFVHEHGCLSHWSGAIKVGI